MKMVSGTAFWWIWTEMVLTWVFFHNSFKCRRQRKSSRKCRSWRLNQCQAWCGVPKRQSETVWRKLVLIGPFQHMPIWRTSIMCSATPYDGSLGKGARRLEDQSLGCHGFSLGTPASSVTVLMRPLPLVQVHPERLNRRLQSSPSRQGTISHHCRLLTIRASTQAGRALVVPAIWPLRQAHRAVCLAMVRLGTLLSLFSITISQVPTANWPSLSRWE